MALREMTLGDPGEDVRVSDAATDGRELFGQQIMRTAGVGRETEPVELPTQGGYRVRTVVTGALTKLFPDRMPACPGGNEFGLSVTGMSPAQKRFLHVEFHNVTGRGGGPDASANHSRSAGTCCWPG